MVDLGLARWSNDLLFLAVVLYALAMFGFAADLAFGDRGAAVRRPGVVPRRRLPAGVLAVALTGLGWATHVGSVVFRGLATHRAPWGNMYEYASMIALVAVTTYLVLLRGNDVRRLGVFVLLPVVLYLGLAGTVLYAEPGPLVPALHSYWIVIHVSAAILGSGLLMVAGVLSAVFLVQERRESRLAVSMGPGAASTLEMAAPADERGGDQAPAARGLLAQLPSSASLDRTAYKLVAFAFPVWTFAIIAGAIWAEAAWGRYWGWDPKETWSFIVWVVFAGYLHARATAGWKGRRAAVIALVGLAALVFNFFGVNIAISGLHSYAGL